MYMRACLPRLCPFPPPPPFFKFLEDRRKVGRRFPFDSKKKKHLGLYFKAICYFECKESLANSAHCTTANTIYKLYYLKTYVYVIRQLQATEEQCEKYLLLVLMHTEYVYISTSYMW